MRKYDGTTQNRRATTHYRATTWSPGFTLVTPSPTDSTIPAPSCPRMIGKAPSGSFPESVYASVTTQNQPRTLLTAGRQRIQLGPQEQRGPRCALTCMADSGVVDLNSDFVCLWRRDLDILDAQLLARFPCYRRLASNSLVTSAGQPFQISFAFFISHSSRSFGLGFPSS